MRLYLQTKQGEDAVLVEDRIVLSFVGQFEGKTAYAQVTIQPEEVYLNELHQVPGLLIEKAKQVEMTLEGLEGR